MSAHLAVVTGPAPGSLEDLAQKADAEHRLVVAAEEEMVAHAIRAGAALELARPMVPYGEWEAWVRDSTGFAPQTANAYRRLYRNREWLERQGANTIKEARRLLSERDTRERSKRIPALKAEARRLVHVAGKSQAEAADIIGVDRTTVNRWLKPGSGLKKQKRLAREREARRALARQERDRAMRKAGGSVAEAYSLIHRTAQCLESACSEVGAPDAKEHMREALRKLYAVEDEIARAVRLS